MSITKITDIDLKNKRVLIREDFNVPITNGAITSDARIRAALPTIEYALQQEASVILMSHLGRPTEGEFNEEFSLAPVAAALSELLKRPVQFIRDWSKGIDLTPDDIALCENVRFQPGEKKNDPALAQNMAQLCDVFVMDAFASAHRAEASTVGIAQFAPAVCAGLLLSKELDALSTALHDPAHPVVAIIGGSKVSTKLTVLENLLKVVDQLIVGGGIANTFLAAHGLEIGKSLYEADLIPTAKKLLKQAQEHNVQILLPDDVIVTKEFNANAISHTKNISEVRMDEMILDIGAHTINQYTQILKYAKTILWNGPVGVFEFPAFAQGTQKIAQAIAASHAFSIAGGGDTLAAIEKFHIADKISYISTGGGAFLEYIEGKQLPAIAILQERSTK